MGRVLAWCGVCCLPKKVFDVFGESKATLAFLKLIPAHYLFHLFIFFTSALIYLKKNKKKKHLDFGQQDLSQDRIREKAFN